MSSRKKTQAGKNKPETEEVINTEETSETVDEVTEDITEETEAGEASQTEKVDAAKLDKEEKAETNDKASERIEELEDKVKRQLAEFDNYRKRTEKEKTQMYETGAKSVLEKLLPIVDNFERAVGSIKPEDEENPHAQGMIMIYKQLMGELEKLEVKPIEAVGCEFNPDFHNAIMQTESDEYESGVIAQELQKGYTYRDTVLRHSMVAVVP